MPRPLQGRVLPRPLADGETAFDVKIRRVQRWVGNTPDWDEDKVRKLLNNRLLPRAILDEPWWDHLPNRALGGAPAVRSDELTVEDMLSEFVHKTNSKYDKKSTRDARLAPIFKHVGPYFAYDGDRQRAVSELTGMLVSGFTALKYEEREVLAELPDTLADLDDDVLSDAGKLREQLDPREWELLMRYGQRGGRLAAADPDATSGRFSLSSRGLSNNEINRCLYRLRDAIVLAEDEHKIEIGDPVRRNTVPSADPQRDILWPDQLEAILDAAAELDAGVVREIASFKAARGGRTVTIAAHARVSRYADLGRVEAITLLAFGGPRVSEFCNAVAADVGKRGLYIRRSKTTAGVRPLHLHTLVRDRLEERIERLGLSGQDPLFANAEGNKRDRNSVRNRLLAPVHARAAELLDERGHDPLPARVTPHSYRRTYLTYLAWAGKPQPFARAQAGHKDSKLVLDVYQSDVPAELDERVPEWLAG